MGMAILGRPALLLPISVYYLFTLRVPELILIMITPSFITASVIDALSSLSVSQLPSSSVNRIWSQISNHSSVYFQFL
jgi:hypothetical protein